MSTIFQDCFDYLEMTKCWFLGHFSISTCEITRQHLGIQIFRQFWTVTIFFDHALRRHWCVNMQYLNGVLLVECSKKIFPKKYYSTWQCRCIGSNVRAIHPMFHCMLLHGKINLWKVWFRLVESLHWNESQFSKLYNSFYFRFRMTLWMTMY